MNGFLFLSIVLLVISDVFFVGMIDLILFAKPKQNTLQSIFTKKGIVNSASNGFEIVFFANKLCVAKSDTNLIIQNTDTVTTISLDSIYAVYFFVTKRIYFLVLGILVCLDAVILTLVLENFLLLLLLLIGIGFILIFLFQKMSIRFGVLFGGTGNISFNAITDLGIAEKIIPAFLSTLMVSAQSRRDSTNKLNILT
jgi:hypothetical protein